MGSQPSVTSSPVLPRDCFVEIVPHLYGLQDLSRFSQVCKMFHEIIDKVFDFKTNKNVNTLTLTPTPFVCPPWYLNRQRRPTEGAPTYSAVFSDRAMVTTMNSRNRDCCEYDFNCGKLCLTVFPRYGYVFIEYDDAKTEQLILKYRPTGKWFFSINPHVDVSQNYYKNLPFILDCLEELQAWKNYCDRK